MCRSPQRLVVLVELGIGVPELHRLERQLDRNAVIVLRAANLASEYLLRIGVRIGLAVDEHALVVCQLADDHLAHALGREALVFGQRDHVRMPSDLSIQ